MFAHNPKPVPKRPNLHSLRPTESEYLLTQHSSSSSHTSDQGGTSRGPGSPRLQRTAPKTRTAQGGPAFKATDAPFAAVVGYCAPLPEAV